MRKSLALVWSALLLPLGLWLVVLGIAGGLYEPERYRVAGDLTLFGGFVVLLILGLVFSRYADDDYRTIFFVGSILLSLGLALLGTFFAFMWFMLSARAYGITWAAFLVCYGLALIMSGVGSYLLAQRVYRVYIYDFLRELPHVYYRYRT
ncbi:MAG: hypothetical protein C4536_09490 [Actinobacteria bacterium]|jgi:hypothetical protein|nr:MAG: hypothetical protein C4536_09490 [Actinomycetota bacterium]